MKNKELDTAKNSDGQKMSRNDALVKIREAKQLLDSLRPKKPDIGKWEEESLSDEDAKPFAFLLAGALSVVAIPFGLMFGHMPTIVISGSSAFLSASALFSLKAINGESYVGNKNQKVRNFLGKIFMSKSQRKWIKDYQSLIVPYQDAVKSYELLVERVYQELEEKGVMNAVNNVEENAKHKQNFVILNKETGVFNEVSHDAYQKYKIDSIVSNPELVQRAILHTLATNKELLP